MLRRIPFRVIPSTRAVVDAILIVKLFRTRGLPDPTGQCDFGARVLDSARPERRASQASGVYQREKYTTVTASARRCF